MEGNTLSTGEFYVSIFTRMVILQWVYLERQLILLRSHIWIPVYVVSKLLFWHQAMPAQPLLDQMSFLKLGEQMVFTHDAFFLTSSDKQVTAVLQAGQVVFSLTFCKGQHSFKVLGNVSPSSSIEAEKPHIHCT